MWASSINWMDDGSKRCYYMPSRQGLGPLLYPSINMYVPMWDYHKPNVYTEQIKRKRRGLKRSAYSSIMTSAADLLILFASPWLPVLRTLDTCADKSPSSILAVRFQAQN